MPGPYSSPVPYDPRPNPIEKDSAPPMAQPWAHRLPTAARALAPESIRRAEEPHAATLPAWAEGLRARVTSPTTALVVMALGLAALFVVPLVGLVFVAAVVLPMVIFQLRAEQRQQYRLRNR